MCPQFSLLQLQVGQIWSKAFSVAARPWLGLQLGLQDLPESTCRGWRRGFISWDRMFERSRRRNWSTQDRIRHDDFIQMAGPARLEFTQPDPHATSQIRALDRSRVRESSAWQQHRRSHRKITRWRDECSCRFSDEEICKPSRVFEVRRSRWPDDMAWRPNSFPS